MPAPANPPPAPNLAAYGSPGGAAVFRGTNYQTDLTTYIAATALAEQPHQLGPTFPPGSPTRIGAEQHWPIDDVAISFNEPIAWIQAKRNADLGDLRDSFAQFVAQLKHGRGRGGTVEPLGPDDRFIFAYEHAPAWAAAAIDVLDRLRGGARVLDEITQGSGPAKEAYDILVEAIGAADATLDIDAVHSVLRRVYFFPIATTALETVTRAALHFVVRTASVAQADDVLYRHLDDVAARRSLRTIDALRTVLREAGCAMLAAPSVRDDVAVLLSETERTLEVAAATSSIETADGEVHLERAVTTAIVDALAQGNVAVTAPAGEGKSVALRDAALRLRAAGHPVVFLAADDAQPHLERTLAQVFERWGEAGFLFIDGFDSLRLGPAAAPLRALIRRLRDTGWHVAIASREYDLARDPVLRQLFPAGPTIPEAYRDDHNFAHVALVRVGPLDASEIADLRGRSASLDRLFANAPPSLTNLLTNAFNLSIAASLAGHVDLSGVRNRGELLNLWWEHRVATGGSANEAALRVILQAIIRRRRLDVPTADVDAHASARDNLLSASVLVHRGSTDDPIAFRHAAIFDYAVERLLLRGTGAATALLGADPDAFVFILPSVRAHFEALYDRSPTDFFAELRSLLVDGRGRAALSLVLAQIPAQRLRNAQDLAPLLDGDPTHAKIFHHIASAALYWAGRGVPLVGPQAAPWSDVALLAAQRLPTYEHDAALLVDESSNGTATPDQGRVLAHASRLLIIDYLAPETTDSRIAWFGPIALPGFIRAIDYDPVPAMPLLRRLVAPERIARVGQFELFPLTRNLESLHTPEALELLYRGIFADVTLPAGTLPIGRPNVAMNFVQDSKQILDLARGMLAQRFAAFLDEAPHEAIRSLCAVVGSQRQGRTVRPFDVEIAGAPHRLLADSSQSWETMPYHDHDDWKVVTQSFERYLHSALDAGNVDAFTVAYEEISAHGPELLLWRILIRSAGRSAESARRMMPLLKQRTILVQQELQEPICDYLAAGYTLLEDDERAELDAAILSVVRDETNDRLHDHRAELLATYADAIPEGLSLPLGPYRHALPPTTRQRELTLRGFSRGDPSFALPNAVAPIEQSPELSAALAEVAPYLQDAGDIEEIVPTIRRLAATIGPADAATPEALHALLGVVHAGLRLKALSDDELREWTPLMLAATTFGQSVGPDGEGPGAQNVTELNALALAATTLPWVFKQTGDPVVAEAVLGLMDHPDSYVRDAALRHVLVLGTDYRVRAWEVVEQAVSDASWMVVERAGTVFDLLVEEDASRAWAGRLAVYDRLTYEIVTDFTVNEIRRLIDWALEGQADAIARLTAILEDPWANPELSKLFAFVLTTRLGPPTSAAAAIVPYLVTFIDRLSAQLESAAAAHGDNAGADPERDRARSKTSGEILAEIANRVEVHSGLAYNTARFDEPAARLAHYRVLLPALEALARAPLPHTAYHVVNTIAEVADLDPAGVLGLGIRAILTGVRSGLALDQFAQTAVRDFLMTYLNAHREVLEADRTALNGFMDVVDAFAAVGWPAWIDVTFALDAIYRE